MSASTGAGSGPKPPHDSIEHVRGELSRFREERDWRRFHTPRNLAMSIAIETGELLEHFQWLEDGQVPAYVSEHRDAVAEELADVMLYVIQLADVLDVSLADALERKLKLNAERYPADVSRGTSAKHTQLLSRPASSSAA